MMLNHLKPATTTATKPQPQPQIELIKPQVAIEPETGASGLKTIPPNVQTLDSIEVLKTETRAGDFVHNSQPMDENFGNVSKLWTDRLHDKNDRSVMTFDDTREYLASTAGTLEDIRAPFSQFSIVRGKRGERDLLMLRDNASDRAFELTENALTQFAQKVGCGKTLPLRLADGDTEDVKTLSKVLQNGARHVPDDRGVLIRTVNNSVRAVLSDQYAIVDNQWFVDVLETVVPGGLVSHFRGDRDAVYFNVLIPDSLRADQSGEFGGMLAAGNSEIGTRKVGTLPSVFRAICMNGCIWDRVDGVAYVRRVHRGEIDLETLAVEIRENLNRQIPLLPRGIELMKQTKMIKTNVAAKLAIGATLAALNCGPISRTVADQIVDGYAQQRTDGANVTAFDILNGITVVAREMNNAAQQDVERAAGSLLTWDSERWAATFRIAETMKTAELKRVFATVS